MNFLGIDIGGTGIKGAIVNVESGELVTPRCRIPTPSPSLPDAVADVVGEITKNLDYSGPAGITFPGVIKKNIVHTAANVDDHWIGIDGRKLFTDQVDGDVTLINDADAAGVAEIKFGAGLGQKGTVVMLTLGTGIGSAVFQDGRLLPNSEFGHLKIRGKDAEKRASERVREEKNLSWKKWSKRLVDFLNELEILFSPDLFIIGGGISKKGDKFIPYLETSVSAPVVPAKMRNEAGIIGAAWMAAEGGYKAA
ncbi:MAG: polyphosphate--glucose phosphotransferase [Chthoniobacterales bacterium]